MNQNQLTAAQQQMTQAQLTYAQKVKGGSGGGQPQQAQPQPHHQHQQHFRMVPTQSSMLQGQTPINALQNYAYPYNYSQQLQQQQQRQRQQQQQRYYRHSQRQRDFFDQTQQYSSSSSHNRRRYYSKPSYSSKRETTFKNAPNMNKMNENRARAARRMRASDVQLKEYETAADRDVLCWIYENQGKCRYGEKCQWLHLDRDTGKYVPTVYIMNSLGKKKKEEREEKKKTLIIEKEENNETELKNKFQLLMEKKIQKNMEKQMKQMKQMKKTKTKPMNKVNKVNVNEEDNKQDTQDSKATKEENNKQSKGGYGSYGTTFDRRNVCWEFNTFVGCRKGTKCKWAHQYLLKDAVHPYTGEKLNGMAVRKFRLSNNI